MSHSIPAGSFLRVSRRIFGILRNPESPNGLRLCLAGAISKWSFSALGRRRRTLYVHGLGVAPQACAVCRFGADVGEKRSRARQLGSNSGAQGAAQIGAPPSPTNTTHGIVGITVSGVLLVGAEFGTSSASSWSWDRCGGHSSSGGWYCYHYLPSCFLEVWFQDCLGPGCNIEPPDLSVELGDAKECSRSS